MLSPYRQRDAGVRNPSAKDSRAQLPAQLQDSTLKALSGDTGLTVCRDPLQGCLLGGGAQLHRL